MLDYLFLNRSNKYISFKRNHLFCAVKLKKKLNTNLVSHLLVHVRNTFYTRHWKPLVRGLQRDTLIGTAVATLIKRLHFFTLKITTKFLWIIIKYMWIICRTLNLYMLQDKIMKLTNNVHWVWSVIPFKVSARRHPLTAANVSS